MTRQTVGSWILCTVAAGLLAGCSGSSGTVLGPTPQSSVSPVSTPSAASGSPQAHSPDVSSAVTPHSLAGVKSWTEPASLPAQAPTATLAALTNAPESMLIVPATLTGAAAGNLPKQLAALEADGHHRVLAVLNLSEIAKTNPLWQADWVDAQGKLTSSAPKWLEPQASRADSDYPVQYWNKDWQSLVIGAAEKLAAQGYEGVCLQGVGAYRPLLKSRKTAGAEMASLVEGIAAGVRKSNPAFSILPENGALLPTVLPAVQEKAYLDAVDGILVQDVFYPGTKPSDNPLDPSTPLLAALAQFQKAGKPVFVTEHLTDPDKIADFLTRAQSMGFIADGAFSPPPATASDAAPVSAAAPPGVAPAQIL